MVRKIVSLGVNQYVMAAPKVVKTKPVNDEDYAIKLRAQSSLKESMQQQYRELEEKKARAKFEENAHPFEYDHKQRVKPLRERLRTPASDVRGFMGEDPVPRDELVSKKLADQAARVEQLRQDEATKKEKDAILADDAQVYAGRKKYVRGEHRDMDIDPAQNKFGASENEQAAKNRAANMVCKEWNQAAIQEKFGGQHTLYAQRKARMRVEGERNTWGDNESMRIGAKTPAASERRQAAENFRRELDEDNGRYGVVDNGVPEWWDPTMHSPRNAPGAISSSSGKGGHTMANPYDEAGDMYTTSLRAMQRVKTGMRVEPTGLTGLPIGNEDNVESDARAQRVRYAKQLEAQQSQQDSYRQMQRAKSRASTLAMLESVPPYVDAPRWETSGVPGN